MIDCCRPRTGIALGQRHLSMELSSTYNGEIALQPILLER